MASVVIQSVTKQFGPKVVLEDVSLELRTGETVGLIGSNGAGKTTLFRLITGEEHPDFGTVTRSRGLVVNVLAQEPQLDSDRTLHDEVGSAFDELLKLEHRLGELAQQITDHHDDPRLAEVMADYDRLSARFEAAGGYGFQTRLNEILGGLGFTQDDHKLPVSVLSGGQKCRAALGKLLLQEGRLLLLDEPTNHLDIDATRWLERFLAGHHGGAVIISHDRYLLDRLVTKVIELENRRVTVYPGNYTNYVRVRETRRLAQQREFEKDQAFIAKERAFIAKHISRQRTREARGRRTRLERRLREGEFVLDAPGQKRHTTFRFEPASTKSHQVLRCDDLSKRYGSNLLFADLTLEVFQGDRLGITGPNGTGKTTLLRLVLGQIEPDAGTVEFFEKANAGYYDQEHAGLDRSARLIEAVASARPDLGEQELRNFLGCFLFGAEDVFRPVSTLSGGEQSRMRLAKLMLSSPAVLVLDEPTNHLDIRSREALEDALDSYTGTIIAVSHDRYFLDRIANRLLVMEAGRHGLYLGGYSEYLAQVEEQRQAEQQARDAARPRQAAGRRKGRSGTPRRQGSPFDSLSIEELESQIIAKEEQVAAIHERFADESIYRNPEAVGRLNLELDAATEELNALNAAWEERLEG